MRIGILTLPLQQNYGGILQAWALQTVLSRMGHEVKVFTISNKRAPLVMPMVWAIRAFNKLIKKSETPIFAETHNKRRYEYINHFLETRICPTILKSIDDIKSTKYDILIAGSDQIWRKQYFLWMWHTNFISKAFFHNINSSKTRKIAYAASFGLDNWQFDTKETKEITEALKDFHSISVREASATDLLNIHCNIDSTIVLDPTMLLTAKEYIEELNLTCHPKKMGVVSYILDPNERKKQFIQKIANSKSLPDIELNEIEIYKKKLSIEDWVSHIASADIVVTDSFHGCVFSIIFRKPLIFLGNEGRGNARFNTLIELFGIENNYLKNISEYKEDFDYSLPDDIDARIENLREKSYRFLKNALSAEKEL